MAFPALIQKILDLRRNIVEADEDNSRLCAAIASLSEESVRMSTRIAHLEMGIAKPAGNMTAALPFGPAGYDLPCGAKVAPVTLIAKHADQHKGAALTVVVDSINE